MVASLNPFGEDGDHSGCRSWRSTGMTVSLTSVALNARSMAISQSCGVRNLRALSLQASGRSISAAGDRTQVPVAGLEHLGDPIDGGRGRIVADEMRDELGGDESSGGRMTAQVANRALAFRHTGLGVFHAQYGFRSWLVKRLFKSKAEIVVATVRGTGLPSPARCLRPAAGPRETADGPSRQHPGKFLHILLRIAAIHAERVQFQQLARVVLVQATSAGEGVCCPPRPARAPRELGPIDCRLSR